MSSVDLRQEWNPDVVATLLSATAPQSCINAGLSDCPAELLEDLDTDGAWGRPASGLSFAVGSSWERRKALFAGVSELWRQGELQRQEQLVLYLNDEPVGFSECCVVRLKAAQEERQCRICFGADAKLLDGCACRGTSQYICCDCLKCEYAAKGSHLDKLTDLRCGLCHQLFTGPAAEILARELNLVVQEHKKQDPENDAKSIQRYKAQVSAATALWSQGKHAEAALIFQEAIVGLDRISGPDSLDVLSARHNLGLVLHAQGRNEEAQGHITDSKAGFSKCLGPEHVLTLKASHNEAMVAQELGHTAEAVQLYRQTLEVRQRVLGPEHVDSLKTACNLGLTLNYAGELSDAERILRETIGRMERVLGRTHPLTLTAMQNLGMTLQRAGGTSLEEALRLSRESSESRHLALGAEHPDTLEGFRDLSRVLLAAGHVDEAEECAQRALSGMERILGFDHPRTCGMLRQLQQVYTQQGKSEQAAMLSDKHQARVPLEVPEAPIPQPRGPVVAFIMSILIVPLHQRRGMGRRVVEHWKSWGKTAGASAVEIRVAACSRSLPFFVAGLGMIEVARFVPGLGSSNASSREFVRFRYSL